MSGTALTTRVLELFGFATDTDAPGTWRRVLVAQQCPYLGRPCLKTRKSAPDVAIGTCSVAYGASRTPVIICPHRLLERRQVFLDALHLLATHEPGNELHVVPEINIPGGSVDYFVVSTRRGRVVDFAGVELQTLDTTGTVWPERQRFLHSLGELGATHDHEVFKPFGMNWKMSAKTILIQLHHKVRTFEHLGKRMVLVLQDCFLGYMRKEFSFAHMEHGRLGDTAHFHAYSFENIGGEFRISLVERLSTNSTGVAEALGLQADPEVAYEDVVRQLEAKLSPSNLLVV